jgi:hypothetical protein
MDYIKPSLIIDKIYIPLNGDAHTGTHGDWHHSYDSVSVLNTGVKNYKAVSSS